MLGTLAEMRGAAGARSSAIDVARRTYLNQKFGRTGDLNNDINLRGTQDAWRQAEFDRLAKEGHAVGRHGPRLTEQALDMRAMFKIDPMTGTTTDFYTKLPHNASRNATKFMGDSMITAEQYVRQSPEYARRIANAIAEGKSQFSIADQSLQDALGSITYLMYLAKPDLALRIIQLERRRSILRTERSRAYLS